ncbi:MAG: efflux RND transporter periplasmic adaptor subunit [Acidobacteria bacterium]|nr:MAG: efflux RND transporter periplasmic adaptor subunit [Acidobacteriota bacterium]
MTRRFLLWTAGITFFALAALGVARLVAPCARQQMAFLDKVGFADMSQACAKPNASAAIRDRLRPAVTITQAAMHDFVDRLFVSGTLVARDEAMVGAQIDGLRITELLAEDGDWVSKGQPLARLDRSQLDALIAENDASLLRADAAIAQATSQIGQFEAVLGQTKADLERARELGVRIIAQATLDQRLASFRTAQSQLAASQSTLAIAEADRVSRQAQRRELMVRIDRTEVKAPVAGIISRRTARLGAVAMATNDALFRIITDGAVDLEAEVPEQSLARLKLGMIVKILLPGAEGQVEGHVRLISEEVDKATRIGKVRVALSAGTPARIGSFASGVAIIDRRLGIAIPTSAVQKVEDGNFVQVVKDDHIIPRKVIIGITDAGLSEVREGIEGGEAVVTRAAAFLRPGDSVRPTLAPVPFDGTMAGASP